MDQKTTHDVWPLESFAKHNKPRKTGDKLKDDPFWGSNEYFQCRFLANVETGEPLHCVMISGVKGVLLAWCVESKMFVVFEEDEDAKKFTSIKNIP